MNEDQIKTLGKAIGDAFAAQSAAQRNAGNYERMKDSVRKSRQSAGEFHGSGDFRTFRREHESWRAAVGLDARNGTGELAASMFDSTFQAQMLLVCFKGPASARVQNLKPGTVPWNLTIDNGNEPDHGKRFEEYFDKIQQIFLPASESPMSRQQFAERTQSVHEDVSVYISDKIALFHLAYTDQQAAQMWEILLESTIKGIYNHVIQRGMIDQKPSNEEEMRTAASTLVANERRKWALNCAESTTLDGLLATSRGSYGTGEQPMDVNQLSGEGVNRFGDKKGDTCRRCNKKGHWARDCHVKLSGGQAARGGQTSGYQSGRGGAATGGHNKTADGGKPKKTKCNYCHKKGHLENVCRKKATDNGLSVPQPQPAQGQGQQRGGGQYRGGGRGGGQYRGGGQQRQSYHIRAMDGEDESNEDHMDVHFLDGTEEDE